MRSPTFAHNTPIRHVREIRAKDRPASDAQVQNAGVESEIGSLPQTVIVVSNAGIKDGSEVLYSGTTIGYLYFRKRHPTMHFIYPGRNAHASNNISAIPNFIDAFHRFFISSQTCVVGRRVHALCHKPHF